MGIPGRKPKPTRIKLMQNNPGQRAILPEPQPRPVAPKCPVWVTAEARREWRRLAPELTRLGLLTAVDGSAFAAYCMAYSHWREAETDLIDFGLVFTTPNGYQQQRPCVAIAQKSLTLMTSLGARFGLAPADRARLNVPTVSADAGDGMLDEAHAI